MFYNLLHTILRPCKDYSFFHILFLAFSYFQNLVSATRQISYTFYGEMEESGQGKG